MLRVVAIVLAAGYGAFIVIGVSLRLRGYGGVKRAQKRGSGRYASVRSATGNARQPRLTPSFWFLLLCVVVTVYLLLKGAS